MLFLLLISRFPPKNGHIHLLPLRLSAVLDLSTGVYLAERTWLFWLEQSALLDSQLKVCQLLAIKRLILPARDYLAPFCPSIYISFSSIYLGCDVVEFLELLQDALSFQVCVWLIHFCLDRVACYLCHWHLQISCRHILKGWTLKILKSFRLVNCAFYGTQLQEALWIILV